MLRYEDMPNPMFQELFAITSKGICRILTKGPDTCRYYSIDTMCNKCQSAYLIETLCAMNSIVDTICAKNAMHRYILKHHT